MVIETPLRPNADHRMRGKQPDDQASSARRRMLVDGPNIMTWVIQPGVEVDELDGTFSQVLGTFQHKEDSDYESLQEYLSERAGWVEPLMQDFTQLHQVARRGDSKVKTDAGYPVTHEICTIAGVPMSIRAFRRQWASDADHAWVGRDIRSYARGVRAAGQPDPHLVVWFHPSYDMPNEELTHWLGRCEEAIEGFIDERMEATDLKWEDVSSWLKVIQTPWATFATLSKPYRHYNRKYEARVRHLVLDPVILATAQQATVQGFVRRVAQLNSLTSGGESRSCGDARDEFYRWRSAYWWTQPAKATIPNRVWLGAVEANNTVSQVDALSKEMADYAAVEDVRHNQRVERHNQRLTWGGLIFAVLAILLPFVYAEQGMLGTSIAGLGVLAASAVLYVGWVSWGRLRRKRH